MSFKVKMRHKILCQENDINSYDNIDSRNLEEGINYSMKQTVREGSIKPKECDLRL